MNRIETIKARLEETQPNVITHIIKFELEERNIISYIDDDKTKETSFLLKNKDIIEEGGLNISEIITDNILEDVICFNGEREEMINVINNIIKHQKNIYSNFKKYWEEQLIDYYNKKGL